MDEGVSNEALLLLAATKGYAVNPRQLAEWHRDGLLPRPTQVSLGQGHGSTSIYPLVVAEQLLALCRLRFDENRKLVRDLGWRLWWLGYEVDMGIVRGVLTEAAGQGDALTGADQSAIEEAAEVLSTARSTPKTRLISQARRQRTIGRDAYGAFLRALLKTLSRQSNASLPHADAAMVEAGLGLTPARKYGVASKPSQLVADEVHYLTAESFADLLERLSDADLCRLRDALVPVFDGVDLLGRLAKRVGPRTGFAARLSRPADRRGEAAWLLLWARSNERSGVAESELPQAKVPEVLGNITRLYRLVRFLRAEVPDLADLLSVKNLTRAACDARYRDRFLRNFDVQARENSDVLKAVFERHPEALELLEWSVDEEGGG